MGGMLPAVVITISDRAHNGDYEDRSGPVARDGLVAAGFECTDVVVVPDEVNQIQHAIRTAILGGARVVFTTGGTGVAPRDVTPEATAALGGKLLPGIGEEVRRRGRDNTPLSIASRGQAWAMNEGRNSALVVNAPGSRGGARDAVAVVAEVAAHIVGQLDGEGH